MHRPDRLPGQHGYQGHAGHGVGLGSGPGRLESFYTQKVSWYTCAKKGTDQAASGEDTGFTCAKIKVPLDYDNPGSETIEIAVKKRAANGDSIGVPVRESRRAGRIWH